MPELEHEQNKESSFLDLLDFIEEEEIEELGIENLQEESFQITTSDQAEYFVKKVKEWQEEEKVIKQHAQEHMSKQKEKIDKWSESKINEFSYQRDRYVSLLEEYAKQELVDSTKKNVKLVEGTLQFRKNNDKIEYNEDEVMEYLTQERDEILVSLQELQEIAVEHPDYGKVIPIQTLASYMNDANKTMFINTKESIDKTNLKKEAVIRDNKMVLRDEEVPGVTITAQEDSFSIK